ncbi:MAG: TonB-dependent receptor [Thermovirgaceae bacterium]|nr:TonB-dependent receptor [Thermovirgaceae bacterium]
MRKFFGTVLPVFVALGFVLAGYQWAEAEVGTVAPEFVTGSRIYTDLDEIPAPTYVITAEDIRSSGAVDLAEVLEKKIPGIFVKQKSGVTQDAQIALRGVVTEVLVLVDGIPLYRSSHGANAATVDYRAFPLEAIDRIEVVKGGGSAIYGSMAAGGVINIITKKPDSAGGRVLAEAGPSGWRRYYVSGNTGGGSLSAGIWYERVEEGQKRLFYDTTPDQRYDALDYKGDACGVNIAGDSWVFRAATGEYGYKYNSPNWSTGLPELNDEKKGYNRYSFRYDSDFWYLLAGYDTQRFDILQNTNNFYEDSAYTAEFGGKSVVGDALLAWGVFYRCEDTEFSAGGVDPVTSKNRSNIAPFGELSYAFGDWVTNLGLRYEMWNQESNDYDELIPKISIQRQFPGGSLFYVSASRVFAMPSMYELYADVPSWWGFSGNPDLKPERGWSYELGLKSAVVANPWNAGLFFLEIQDKIRTNDFWTSYINLAEFRSYGIEAAKKWRLGSAWTVGLQGTWQHPEEKTTSSSAWARSYGIPEWEIGGSLEYRDGPWAALLSINWAGNRMGNATWDPENYVLADLTLSWESGSDTIRLYCVNIFDSDYLYNSAGWYYYGPERGIRLSWERRF